MLHSILGSIEFGFLLNVVYLVAPSILTSSILIWEELLLNTLYEKISK